MKKTFSVKLNKETFLIFHLNSRSLNKRHGQRYGLTKQQKTIHFFEFENM